MQILSGIGAIFLIMGVFSGLMLTIAPLGLGLTATSPGIALYVLFPLLCVLGYLFVALSVRSTAIAKLTQGLGAVLLVLAVLAMLALVIFAAGFKVAEGSTVPLWYVLVLGSLLGGMAASIKASENSDQ